MRGRHAHRRGVRAFPVSGDSCRDGRRGSGTAPRGTHVPAVVRARPGRSVTYGTALILLVVAAAGCVTGARRARGGVGGVGSVGGNTTLLLWPAGPPLFGDLPGGGPGTTVQVADVRTGRQLLRRIRDVAPGDFTVPLLPVGRWLVYNGDHGVSAVENTLTGRPHVLGRAIFFLPAAEPDRVWLVRTDSSRGRATGVQPVRVSDGRAGAPLQFPAGNSGHRQGERRGSGARLAAR